MRKRSLILCCLGTVVVAGVSVAQDPGIQAVIGNVFLQNTTPGTVQAGHASIGGTFRAGQVNVSQATATTVPVIGNNTAVGEGTSVGGSFSAAQQSGIGVRGTTTSPTGGGTGVLGIGRGGLSNGVVGRIDATTGSGGAAVKAEVLSVNAKGVDAFSTKGIGVSARSELNAGLFAQSVSTTQPALVAQHPLGTAGTTSVAARLVGGTRGAVVTAQRQGNEQTIGVESSSVSTAGIGVKGTTTATSGSGKGVVGETLSPGGGMGVSGLAPATGASFGVHGKCLSAQGFGVFCEGNQATTGNKSFLIDHPQDPENRYLRHYCAEGPEPRNVYQGSVVTGNDGFARVQLPPYFESVNKDPLVQLTVDDTSADFVLCKVVGGVQGGAFRLRTSKPRTKVYWRVDAVRNDRWTQSSGHSADPVKPGPFRGTYLHPELYGKPASMSQSGGVAATTIGSRP